MSEPPLSGRRREARRNDAAILESAHDASDLLLGDIREFYRPLH